jgi:hypothetical protein
MPVPAVYLSWAHDKGIILEGFVQALPVVVVPPALRAFGLSKEADSHPKLKEVYSFVYVSKRFWQVTVDNPEIVLIHFQDKGIASPVRKEVLRDRR